jgi:hypothetical protein
LGIILDLGNIMNFMEIDIRFKLKEKFLMRKKNQKRWKKLQMNLITIGNTKSLNRLNNKSNKIHKIQINLNLTKAPSILFVILVVLSINVSRIGLQQLIAIKQLINDTKIE